MADKDEAPPPGPSRRDKGKAKVGEPSDYSDDDQAGQRNEPGPGPGDDSYSALGPLMRFCLSKTLTPREVSAIDPGLLLDAYETSVLLDSPDIITSPDSASFSRILNVFDVEHQYYRMLLSYCVLDGWTGYSITKDWDIFVRRRNLVAGDEISFHRSRDIDSYYQDYNYVLTNKSDKLEVFTRFKATDYDKNTLRGPGSRYMPRIAMCLSKILTSAEVDRQYPRLYLTANEAFCLTCRAEILEYDPGNFSEDLVVFDEHDNRYRMNISNRETGWPTRFFLNTGWEEFVRNSGVKEGDDLEIYRFLDHKLVPGKFYYALRFIMDPQPLASVAPGEEDRYVLAKTLTLQNVSARHPALYIDAYEAYTLTKCAQFLDTTSFPDSVMLPVYDDVDVEYDMLLSHCAVNIYSLSRGWGRFVRDHQLRDGDRVFFYRYTTGEDGVEPFYDVTYVRKDYVRNEESKTTEVLVLPEEKPETPDRKRKPGPGSRGIPDPVIKLTKTLSAHQGNIPKLCLDASEALLLTGFPLDLDNCPSGTILTSLLVYDEGDMSYDMVLTHLKRDDGEVICTLDSGWQRFVESHGLKVGDTVTIYRIHGETYYAVRYTRASLPSGSGACGVEPSGSGPKEDEQG